MLSKNSADALLDDKVSIFAIRQKEITNLILCLLSISTSVAKIIVNSSSPKITLSFASDAWSNDRAQLLGCPVRQPGVLV